MSSARKITLTSSDGETFEIDEVVALESQTIKQMIKNDCANDNGVHLLNVTSNILAKIIEYCKKHVEATSSVEKPSDDVLEAWDTEFVKVDEAMLFGLASAANYLNIKSLTDLTCKTIAKMLQSKLPDDIRRTFKIVNDYSPEEEEEVHSENKWAWE